MLSRVANPFPTSEDADDGRLSRVTKTRPRAAVLWNGMTLESLGIADLLKSVDFTLTLGRTPPSEKHPAGKPKVGGATLVFLIPNEAAGVMFRQMLYLSPRPVLTVGFGFHDGNSYWLGETGIRRGVDRKKFGRCRGYKVDSVSWDYGAGYPTLTLNGMVGQALRLAEHRRPTVWKDTTLADIAKGIALENGVTVRISGAIPANQRLEHVVQYAGESRLDALDRVVEQHGGALHVTTEPEGDPIAGTSRQYQQGYDGSGVVGAVPGTTQAYQYEFVGRSEDDTAGQWSRDQGAVRTVLTIRSIEEDFVDLAGMEQVTDVVIGWAPHLSPAKFGFREGRYLEPPDYVASSIKPTEDNVARSAPSAGGVKKGGGPATGATVPIISSDPANTDRLLDVAERFVTTVAGGPVQPEVVPTKQRHRSAAHEDLGGKPLTEAQAQAALAAAGIKTRLTIVLSPGAPELSPGARLLVRGTYTHDGRYGVEEARNSWNKEAGLVTTLTARPILAGSGKGGTKKVKATRGTSTDVAILSADPNNPGRLLDVAERFVVTEGKSDGKVAGTREPDEISAGDDATLDREIRADEVANP